MGTPKQINELDAGVGQIPDNFILPARDPAATPAKKWTIAQAVAVISGLFKNAGKIQLGQPVGQAGDPAELLNDSEIPMFGVKLVFGSDAGNKVGIFDSAVINIVNSGFQKSILQAKVTYAGNMLPFLFSTDGLSFTLNFNILLLSIEKQNALPCMRSTGTISSDAGYKSVVRKTSIANDHFTTGDSVLIVDDALGNATIDISNIPTYSVAKFGHIRKKGNSANTVTLTVTGGVIYKPDGTNSNTYLFPANVQGVEFVNGAAGDENNVYILSTLNF